MLLNEELEAWPYDPPTFHLPLSTAPPRVTSARTSPRRTLDEGLGMTLDELLGEMADLLD